MTVNLDAFPDAAELQNWARRTYNPSRATAASLFDGARPRGYTLAAGALNNYAWNKAAAMRLRANGNIGAAQIYEAICERIYAQLPAYARW